MGTEQREYVFEVNLPAKGGEDREFVEQIWGRRKVGYLLDQIRANGEKKELVDEVVALAKKLGIATPYTSYLIVPDSAMPVAGGGGGRMLPAGRPVPASLDRGASKPQTVVEFVKQNDAKQLEKTRDQLEENRLKSGEGGQDERKARAEAASKKDAFDEAKRALTLRRASEVQAGRLGVDLSVESNNLRNQARVAPTAVRNVAGRNCLEIGGVWIDDAFDASLATVSIKAQSPAYFRILERQPQMKEVFKLGNFLAWVTPNKKALIIDGNGGQEEISDAEIDALFQIKK
jgi:Ca-activated chloride channel family protein